MEGAEGEGKGLGERWERTKGYEDKRVQWEKKKGYEDKREWRVQWESKKSYEDKGVEGTMEEEKGL